VWGDRDGRSEPKERPIVTVPEVDASTGDALVAEGALLVDVRTPDEWNAGHAPGALHLPLDQLSARHAELPTDRRIVVICRSGGRSARATEALVGAGYDAVNLAGGMQAWAALGLGCVTDADEPGTVA
jgi:rhodanese-related sulfurtransferase